VSADLIFGVATSGASQPPAVAAEEVTRVAALGVHHVSAYALTIEPTTRFGELARAGRLPLAKEETVADSFVAIEAALARAGFEHYEISNYARPGARARHNLGYWRGHDYLGLGCAAVGTMARGDKHALRYRNPPTPRRYLEQIERAVRGLDGAPKEAVLEAHESELLTPDTRLRERIMLGLRLLEGIDLEAAAAELGVDPWPAARRRAAERLARRGWLVIDGPRLVIPQSAWLHADGTAAALF
jgi:oxygen-independent coproporphyrinogen-3 oxidase